MQQISFAGLQQLLNLRSFHWLLQNDFADPKVARTVRADCFFANKTHRGIEDPVLALGTFANWFLAGEINLRHSAIGIPFILSEIKLDFVFWRQPQYRGERFAHSAAESLQRADLPVFNQSLDFLALKEFPRNNFPQ